MKKLLIGLICSAPLAGAFAMDYDLQTCMFNNGLPMHQKSCESLKKRDAQNAEQARRYNERQAANRLVQDEQRAQAEAKQQEVQREQKLKQAEWKAEKDADHAMGLKAQQEQIQWEKATAKAASDRTAKQKSICGEDYRSPRVGMTLVRAKECVAEFKLKGQINRADGVVSTYMAGQTYLHVMDGQIVSWGR